MPIDEKLLDLVDQNGRLQYSGLVRLINNTGIDYFTNYSSRPFLVGKELYDGLLTKDQFSEAKTLPISRKKVVDDTSFFHRTEGESAKNDSITRAIFALNKKRFSKELSNIITVGRHSENDIVIADYSISRYHAKIEIYFDKFFVSDNGSTNGSCVDGHELLINEKKQLQVGSIASFGRIVFMMMTARDLYIMLKQDQTQ